MHVERGAEAGSPSEAQALDSAVAGLDKIIVAIHGIGSQRKSDTIQSVARQFSLALNADLPIQPLGFFQVESTAQVHISRLAKPPEALGQIGFAEVYWADIPREAVKASDTLEEAKRWARTVVSRARATYKSVPNGVLGQEDFELATGVLEELIETISVLDRLMFVADKAGVFRFSIAPILRDYLGDVQIVAEFEAYRARIVSRFHLTMERIAAQFPAHEHHPELYIVAHSEGTVVSFLALLEALASKSVKVLAPTAGGALETREVATDWIRLVRGYMTLGSPIDKHLMLWSGLWKGTRGKLKTEPDETGTSVRLLHTGRTIRPIEWRNYYDYGDPVGFKLESARHFLEQEESCGAFRFSDTHDMGYSRSLVPGKAHVDYWNDDAVFDHFIHDVVLRRDSQAPAPAAPASLPGFGLLSTALPYLVSFGLHWLALYVLFKSVANFLDEASAWRNLGGSLTVSVLALLHASVTVSARLPRLVKQGRSWKWPWLALAAFSAGGFAYHSLLSTSVKSALIDGLAWCPLDACSPSLAASIPMLTMAGLVACSGWLVPRKPKWARRMLLLVGTALVASILGVRLASEDVDEGSLWPIFLGGAGFLYLWWLGILLFDLAFVWHRYIRQSVGVDTLRAWNARRDAKPKSLSELLGTAHEVTAPRA